MVAAKCSKTDTVITMMSRLRHEERCIITGWAIVQACAKATMEDPTLPESVRDRAWREHDISDDAITREARQAIQCALIREARGINLDRLRRLLLTREESRRTEKRRVG